MENIDVKTAHDFGREWSKFEQIVYVVRTDLLDASLPTFKSALKFPTGVQLDLRNNNG